MAKKRVSKSSFELIPEGTHVFKVVGCTDKYEDFGKVSYELQTSKGQKITTNYNFVDNKGEVNEIADYYWSKFVRACLNMNANDEPEIDFSDVVGCYVEAEVKHNTYIAKKGDHKGEEMTGANIVDKTFAPATGFNGASASDDEDDDDMDGLDDFDVLDDMQF